MSPEIRSLDRYAPDAKAWIVAAQSMADQRNHAEVSPLHLLVEGLEHDPGVAAVMRDSGVDVLGLRSAADRALGALSKGDEPAYLSPRLLDLLSRAEREAITERSAKVTVAHLLGALSQEVRGPAGELLGAFGVFPGSLKAHLGALSAASRRRGANPAVAYERDLLEEIRQGSTEPVIGRDAELRRVVTILERREKSHPLLVGEPGVGKRAVIRALAQRLARGDVPTTLAGARLVELALGRLLAGARLRADVETRLGELVDGGDRGAELRTIVVLPNLDQLYGQGQLGAVAGEALKSSLSRGAVRVLATTTPEGVRRLSERDPELLRELTVVRVEEPSVDLAVEILRGIAGNFEAHHGIQVGEGAIVASVTLAKRYVQDRFLPDSAIDLLDESCAALRVAIDGMPVEKDEAERRLESLRAQVASLSGADDELSTETRLRLEAEADSLSPRVAQMRDEVEQRRGIVAAVRTLRRELDEARSARARAREAKDLPRLGELEHVTLPDLERRLEAAEQAARRAGASSRQALLSEEHVARTVAGWTGIPVAKMLEAEAEKLMQMESRLETRVVGQHEAVVALSRAVRRGRVGLRDPRRPIGSFLFLGPSGVGKTELAKALAEFLFDSESALTRLDMSEFMERHMAQRLIGAPPGYADSERGGFLTEAVRRRPYSVLLFDEVEKAHEDVFNLLLQVLDDGRLTDGRGRTADFSNTVVLMTSNIGSDRILEAQPHLFESEEGREALRDILLDQLGAFFRPEFLNRIDDVVVFRPLSKDDLRRIVDIQLDAVRRLLAPRQVDLEVEDSAKDRLVELGYEPSLGARPLRRAIVRHIQDPLAQKILEGGDAAARTLRVSVSRGDLVFSSAETGPGGQA